MTNAQLDALIESIEDAGDNSAEEVRTVLQGIKNSFVFIGEVKFVKMLTEDIATYFETTGITSGKGLIGGIYQGWAICNGLNGTTNDDGLVSIAYGSTNDTLGDTGGEATHILTEEEMPLHGHPYIHNIGGNSNMDDDGGLTTDNNGTQQVEDAFSGTPTYLRNQLIGGTGGNQSHNNMQPYVVELKIQRIE